MAMIMKSNNTGYFKALCSAFSNLNGVTTIVSDLKSASLDDSNKNNMYFLYENKPGEGISINIDMDVIKLDDMTEPFKNYMKNVRNLKSFEQPHAVDAICVDRDNEWFLIEFKNCSLDDSEVRSSIRKKMFGSLWFIFTMSSIFSPTLFNTDITEFSRKHITYIVVVSRKKNPKEFHLIRRSPQLHFTPYYFEKYKGYYFKDVLLYTEDQFQYFVKNFKV